MDLFIKVFISIRSSNAMFNDRSKKSLSAKDLFLYENAKHDAYVPLVPKKFIVIASPTVHVLSSDFCQCSFGEGPSCTANALLAI